MKKPTVESLEIAKYIYTFINEYAPVHKTASEHTLKNYKNSLALYLTFLEKERNITPSRLSIDCFSLEYMEGWMKWIQETRGCSAQTCNIRLGALRTFLKYLSERNLAYLSVYEMACTIPSRKIPKRTVNGLSKTAVKQLLEMPKLSTKTGRRDLAFMILLYSTAVRLDEALSLKIQDVHLNLSKPYISIMGKGHKRRTLYLMPKVVAHLKKYIEEYHGKSPEPGSYLFYSRNIGTSGKLTQAAIAKMLKKHAKAAHQLCDEVPLGLHAHQFRHAKASHWLEDGMNIVQISFLLGHEQLETTMIYLDITTEDERKALATLEYEKDKSISPKWKNKDGSLVDFCGIKR